MCVSRPGRIVQVREGMAEVESSGLRTWFNALMVPDAKTGDWVLTHTGLVLSVIGQADVDAIEALMVGIDQAATEGFER